MFSKKKSQSLKQNSDAPKQKDLMKDSETYGAEYRKSHQGSDILVTKVHEKNLSSKNKTKTR